MFTDAVASARTRSQAQRALALVAVALLTGACASTRPSGAPPATSVAACPSFGSTGTSTGAARVSRSPAVALLRNVQVQASSCVDEVAFLFTGGVPGWSAGYRAGPLTEDPSGKPAEVAGAAHLVIRFEPAAGVDLAFDHPAVTYDGPAALRPASPSGVAEVRRLGDFESVMSWAIGLDRRHPFQLVTRGDQLVVRLLAPAPRATRCSSEDPAVSVGYPAGWYAELSDRWACRYFNPAPFVIHPATDAFSWAVTVERADTSAREVVARTTAGGTSAHSHAARVAGLPATVLDVTETGKGMYPAGYEYRLYVVDTGSRALTIQSAPGPPGGQTERDRAAADRIAALMHAT